MFKRLILYIGLMVAIILYYCAPRTYSLSFCYICFAVFILAFILLYKEKCSCNLIKFEFIFSITFFFTNYVYPLFCYSITPYFSLFHLDFPEEYISRACALVTVGYVAFCVGVFRYQAPDVYISVNNLTNRFKIPSLYVPITITLTLLLIFSLFGILMSGIYDGNWGEGKIYKVLADIFIYYIVFAKFTSGVPIRKLLYNNKLFFIIVGGYILEITLIGNRGLLLRISILILFLYTNFYKKINKGVILLSLIGGMVLLYYVGTVRGGGEFDSFKSLDMPIMLQIGKDLIINNRSLYVLMDYYHEFGPTYGRTWLMNILSIIPFGQSAYLSISGDSLSDINSASLVTDLHFSGTTDDVIGLGTNLIGDIYVCFGLFGVMLFMYILGRGLSYAYYQGIKGNSIYIFIYAMLFMDCIILTRSAFFTSIRPIIWGLFLYFLAKSSIKVDNKTSINI